MGRTNEIGSDSGSRADLSLNSPFSDEGGRSNGLGSTAEGEATLAGRRTAHGDFGDDRRQGGRDLERREKHDRTNEIGSDSGSRADLSSNSPFSDEGGRSNGLGSTAEGEATLAGRRTAHGDFGDDGRQGGRDPERREKHDLPPIERGQRRYGFWCKFATRG